MKKLFAVLALLIGGCAALPDHVEFSARVSQSVVPLARDGELQCSATKVAPGIYLTARHCVLPEAKRANGELPKAKGRYTQITVGGIRVYRFKIGETNADDWAVLRVLDVDPTIPSARVSCDGPPAIGTPVAYIGYPGERKAFYTGYVSSHVPGPYSADFWNDTQVSPGASGSALFNLLTGEIIGVVTRGAGGFGGLYAMGAEDIRNTPLC